MWLSSALASEAYAATDELAKEGFRVTLIDRFPYNTFQPLLYQVATGGLNPGDVTYSLRFFAARHEGVRFRCAGVVGIDHDQQEVICDDGIRIGFDYLIIGNGITTNHFGIPGAAEYTMSMYTRAEALRVRDTIFGSLEIIARHVRSEHARLHRGHCWWRPNRGGDGRSAGRAQDRDHAVDLSRAQSGASPCGAGRDGRHLLAPFDDSLRRYALQELIKRGVDVRLKTAISEVEADRVDFKDGSSMPVDLVIWAAGVSGDPQIRDWGIPIGRAGRIEVNEDTRVIGEERIFAIGDG